MKEKIAIISILANLILAGVKIFVGFIANSSAVLAEGFHSLTDIFSSFIGYFGIKVSQKPADQKHPYGHYKMEVVSGIIITIILFITGIGVVYNGVISCFSSEKLQLGYLAILVMLFSAIINFITSKIKIFYGKRENSLTLLSDGTHDIADTLVSLAVIFGLFLSKFWGSTDSILAIIIGLYIIKESFSLGKEAMDSLLDVSAGKEIEDKIKSIAKTENVDILDLKTQKKGSVITANLEIQLQSDLNIEEATQISEKLKIKLINNINNLSYVSIQIKAHNIEAGFYQPKFGKGFGWSRKGRFVKEIDTASGQGPGGDCVCPKCGYKIFHEKGNPCSNLLCPKCQINLDRG
jgi:cation diffusion facilitator family transporter